MCLSVIHKKEITNKPESNLGVAGRYCTNVQNDTTILHHSVCAVFSTAALQLDELINHDHRANSELVRLQLAPANKLLLA